MCVIHRKQRYILKYIIFTYYFWTFINKDMNSMCTKIPWKTNWTSVKCSIKYTWKSKLKKYKNKLSCKYWKEKKKFNHFTNRNFKFKKVF